MNKHLPVAVIVGSFIIGGFIYNVQLEKQKSIEKQQQVKIEAEQFKEQTEREEESRNKILLADCLKRATDKAFKFREINGTKKDDGTVWASGWVAEMQREMEKDAQDVCYQQFK